MSIMPAHRPGRSLLRNVGVVLVLFAAAAGLGYWKRERDAGVYDKFARCLAGQGVKMYGLFWCAHCQDQKNLFGNSFRYVPYVECGIRGSRKEEPVCIDAGVKRFPTWQFADGERRQGVMQLQDLSARTGCALP